MPTALLAAPPPELTLGVLVPDPAATVAPAAAVRGALWAGMGVAASVTLVPEPSALDRRALV
ncbi:hypothetical protein GB931_05555 [Modestobacter sp. I12A-02628]|uniref:Uncharacterized protein n=1 Tax=Goekera deserti TaxID=2497753 RepID=A0A7K3WB99_9ACTN|nr:hypothetical protein [Goekera deserti]MPQ97399.1 hypothetical protein [Goekera deserti]NDI48000.1 hypothetical protein [Goekera deserti]NEL53748.1 hypothetical protein [Goekera deserti]